MSPAGFHLRSKPGPEHRSLDPRLALRPSGPLRVFSGLVPPVPCIMGTGTVPTKC